jgi:hypothetical protein
MGIFCIFSCSKYLSSAAGYTSPIKTIKLEIEGNKTLRENVQEVGRYCIKAN